MLNFVVFAAIGYLLVGIIISTVISIRMREEGITTYVSLPRILVNATRIAILWFPLVIKRDL